MKHGLKAGYSDGRQDGNQTMQVSPAAAAAAVIMKAIRLTCAAGKKIP
jgi:hypothetical protein